MAAAAFFYATIELQWQLLIVVIFSFFSTLAFFSVLFNDTSNEGTEPLIPATVVDNDTINDDSTSDEHLSDRSIST